MSMLSKLRAGRARLTRRRSDRRGLRDERLARHAAEGSRQWDRHGPQAKEPYLPGGGDCGGGI